MLQIEDMDLDWCIAECKAQAKEQLHPEFSRFMEATKAHLERLRDEVRVLRGSHDWLSREKERLETAIQRTLDENGHLADGDNCTLIHLKRSLPTPNPKVTGHPPGT